MSSIESLALRPVRRNTRRTWTSTATLLPLISRRAGREVAGQDLDRHGGRLLADAIERLEPGLKGPSGRPVCPEAPHVAIKLVGHASGRPHDPTRPDGRETVGHRPGAHGP